ncbi:hypothetical protein FE839_09190 [Klebsiella indica]|uniref:Transposase IS66 central domain-containing protein n=1 Tax=Klebsiella indica TaxID=2582917 RepID=A0A5R9LJY9_9ENTR|nr:hypothetical protein FE839_09190 [Klebsiella indica]
MVPRLSHQTEEVSPAAPSTGFTSGLQVDAYAGVNELCRSGQITEAACRAHARREIHDAHIRGQSPLTEEVREWSGGLYTIEANVREMLMEQRLA